MMNQKMTVAMRALQDIADWKMPGRIYAANGSSMSYGAAFGSNGERDVIKGIALRALNELQEGM